jgi:hypothetical protein
MVKPEIALLDEDFMEVLSTGHLGLISNYDPACSYCLDEDLKITILDENCEEIGFTFVGVKYLRNCRIKNLTAKELEYIGGPIVLMGFMEMAGLGKEDWVEMVVFKLIEHNLSELGPI